MIITKVFYHLVYLPTFNNKIIIIFLKQKCCIPKYRERHTSEFIPLSSYHNNHYYK